MYTKFENLEKEYTQYVSKTSSNGSTNNYSTIGYDYYTQSCSDTAKICNQCNKLKCETHTSWYGHNCNLTIACNC